MRMNRSRPTLDFGNGITTSRDVIVIAHDGLEYPDVEIASLQNAVLDGGVVSASRAPMRRITLNVWFRTLTRRQVARAFSPSVTRILSSPTGSLPYVVAAALEFDDQPGPVIAAIPMLSELAYPEGPSGFIDIGGRSGGLEFALEYPHGYDDFTPAGELIIDSRSDVTCPPAITLELASSASDVSVALNGLTATVTGALSAGDVVVIDSAHWAVTVNGTDRLAWFDRAGKWPMLEPGPNLLSSSELARIAVVWKPRLMGLV